MPLNITWHNNFLLICLLKIQDNEAIRSEDQNDESIFGSNGRLFKDAQSNLINSSKASTSNFILIVSFMSPVFSVILSKLLSIAL